jgi:hypothetical protein
MKAAITGWRAILVCAVCSVACLLVLATAVPASALPPGWRVTQLTDNTYRDDSICVDGSNIAYAAHLAGTTDNLLIYSAGTGITRTVASGVNQAAPIVSGALVAYASGTGDNREIYVWDSRNAIVSRVTNNAFQDTAPALSGNLLAWQRRDGTDWEICMMDLSSGAERMLPNNFVDDTSPVVEGSWIAYLQEDPAGEIGEVFVRLYNVSTGVNTLVTPQSDPAQDLRLDDDLLAFVSTRDFPAHQVKQVMLYNPATRGLRAVTTDLEQHEEMELGEGRIAWVTDQPGSDSEVTYQDIESGYTLSMSAFLQPRGRWPVLSNKWLIWQDWDGHDWEIVGRHFPTGTIVQLTDNEVNDDYPRMSDSRVAWTSWETDTNSEVFLASFFLPFTDVGSNHPYRDAIENLFVLEIMSGYSATSFGVDDPLLRQQFAKMIVLTTGVDCDETDVCRFVDVDVSGPASLYPDNYVEAAAREGLTQGKSSILFAPFDRISRAQVMTMIVRAGDRFVSGGLDDPPPGWHGYFSDFTDPTHGQNARIAEYNGLLVGIDLDGWGAWTDASRGEVAQMLWNLWELMQ